MPRIDMRGTLEDEDGNVFPHLAKEGMMTMGTRNCLLGFAIGLLSFVLGAGLATWASPAKSPLPPSPPATLESRLTVEVGLLEAREKARKSRDLEKQSLRGVKWLNKRWGGRWVWYIDSDFPLDVWPIGGPADGRFRLYKFEKNRWELDARRYQEEDGFYFDGDWETIGSKAELLKYLRLPERYFEKAKDSADSPYSGEEAPPAVIPTLTW